MTEVKQKTGLEAVAAMFERAKSQDRPAFLPYFPIGYPDYDSSLEALYAMSRLDVDGFEIGIPFSDPLADGPIIQAATQKALENGVTVRKCLEAVRTLRERGVQQPMLMMGYVNPMLAYGAERFVQDARAAGVDGLIIPDLPPEEADQFLTLCRREGLALIFFLAPTSNAVRIDRVAEQATGFIYVVALTGVTGVRTELPPDLRDYIARLRARTTVPLVLGFGISTPDHARMLKGLVDGFIVASALIRAAAEGIDHAVALAGDIRRALDS
ncbi:MAG: tryptophan synthase subunit alpha [Anaerolineae bacterium]|nr:tryptophan synthase subunit alpha [Anaerolineae bacterium]